MKPSYVLDRSAKIVLSIALCFVCPLLSAQNNKKSNNAAPPPPAPKAAPAKPAAAPVQHPNGASTGAARGPAAGNANGGAKGAGAGNGGGKGTGASSANSRGKEAGLGNSGGGGKGAGGSSVALYQPHPGDQEKSLPGGRKEFSNPKTGQRVVTDAHGNPRTIEAHRGLAGDKIVINRGPHGGRVVETGRFGNRVVSYGGRRGFVERPLRAGYISRTYVYGGHSYAHVYREYRYHDVVYYHYVPAYYYGPRFYGWAVTPWGAPVAYVWGGPLVTPWVYGGYFTPYPVYASPDLWLTDYLLTENLKLAYQNQHAGNDDQAPPAENNAQAASAPLSPEIKAQIAEEVRTQLAAERAAAAQPASSASQQPAGETEQLPPAMNQKFFVVSSSLELTTADGNSCSLSPGDVIQRRGKVVDANGGVAVEVVSSKSGDCAAESASTVQLAQLEDMHNQLREQLDSGLNLLAKNQAKGLPTGPASGQRAVADGTAEPAAGAEEQLVAQDGDASKLEAQVRQN
jgi:hypothetical protein